jgi:hypothetical protein
MEWLEKKYTYSFLVFLFSSLFILFITRSAVGIGNVASVVDGGEDKFVVLLDEEEVETLLDTVVLVAIILLSGRK